jgi:hypothetical protein
MVPSLPLFTSILAVWDHMVEFSAVERLTISEFQQALESDRFATGSHFAGVLLSIR